MRPSSNKKTRSMDFSDLLSSPSPPAPPPHKPLEETRNEGVQKSSSSSVEVEEDAEPAEEEERDATPATGSNLVGGVKLTRTCSVAAAAPANNYSSSPRFRTTRTTSSGIQSAVKKVFSMRRSSSVSERYCRIYDHQRAELQPEPEPVFDDDDEAAAGADNNIGTKTRSNMKAQKKNGILKACKRLLGF